jgi:hypothetical protein
VGAALTPSCILSTVLDRMIDEQLLSEAVRERDHLIELQHQADRAQVSYQHAIRRLNAAGATLREIADALGLSYQRVHQIVDVSTGKGALKNSTTDITRVCRFCGTPQQAPNLIAGPGISICSRCVDLAAEVAAEGVRRSDAHRTLASVEAGDAKAHCGFCGKRRDQVSGMAEAPLQPPVGKSSRGRRDRHGVRICAECLLLCEEIFVENHGRD